MANKHCYVFEMSNNFLIYFFITSFVNRLNINNVFQFKSLQDVVLRFLDEKVCEAYLEQLRWNGKPECPHCECSKMYRLKSVKQPYKCGDRFCGKKFSVRIGLIFEASNIPLSKWFIAIFLMSNHKKGISSCQLARDLNITQKSGWHMVMRIREMMRAKITVKWIV